MRRLRALFGAIAALVFLGLGIAIGAVAAAGAGAVTGAVASMVACAVLPKSLRYLACLTAIMALGTLALALTRGTASGAAFASSYLGGVLAAEALRAWR